MRISKCCPDIPQHNVVGVQGATQKGPPTSGNPQIPPFLRSSQSWRRPQSSSKTVQGHVLEIDLPVCEGHARVSSRPLPTCGPKYLRFSSNCPLISGRHCGTGSLFTVAVFLRCRQVSKCRVPLTSPQNWDLQERTLRKGRGVTLLRQFQVTVRLWQRTSSSSFSHAFDAPLSGVSSPWQFGLLKSSSLTRPRFLTSGTLM